jgi:hypothetical protein
MTKSVCENLIRILFLVGGIVERKLYSKSLSSFKHIVLEIKEKVEHQVHLLVHVLNEFGLVFKHIFFIVALVYYHRIFILFLRCLLLLVVLSNKVSEDLRYHLDTKESFLVLLK